MNIKEKKINYIEVENTFTLKEELENGILFNVSIFCINNKFLDYQKDLIQDFVADFIGNVKNDEYDINQIKNNFELGLQNFNSKLKIFAEKVRDVDFFAIKGFIQIIIDNVLITSMIGDVSVMIFRNKKMYYSLHNGINNGKIDLFSDFVEGDIEFDDEIIYVGTRISDLIDDSDTKEMEDAIKSQDMDLVYFLDEILGTRIDRKSMSFIEHYTIQNIIRNINKGNNTIENRYIGSKNYNSLKNKILTNKYYVTIAIFGIIILFLLYHLLTQILKKTESDVFITASGIQVDVTIEDIKKDIHLFRSMPADSDDKSQKYNEIVQKLDMLESKGRRLEDIAQLRKVIQTNYYEGFNIIYISKLDNNDSSNNTNTKIITFNSSEIETLGEMISLNRGRNLIVGGKKASLIGIVNDGMRGNIVKYGIDEDIVDCRLNLLTDGTYCYTRAGNIFNITRSGIESLTISSLLGFPSNISGISTFGKTNLYVFQDKLDINNKLVTRYRNVVGSQSQFQAGTDYSVSFVDTGTNFGNTGFGAFEIDGTFLAWSDNKLYQFWREQLTSSTLDYRTIPMLGGDKFTNFYSNNIKILSFQNSPFVCIFDKEKQTFTVYESRATKTNETFSKNYSLYYMFRFFFDLENNKINDVVIPGDTGNKPILYVLSNEGINKINLYEFIDSIKENNTLKKIE